MSTPREEILGQIETERDPIKQARLIKYAQNEDLASLHDISLLLKKHPTFISHLVRTVKLPDLVLDGYYAHTISLAHLIVLSRLEQIEDIIKAYKEILAHNLSSMQTEILVRELKYHVKDSTLLLTKQQLDTIRKGFKEKYPQGKIQIMQSKIKGKIVIEFMGESSSTTTSILTLLKELIEDEKEDLAVLE